VAFAWVLVGLFSALTVPGTWGLLDGGGAAGAAWVSLRLVALAYVADRLLVRTAVEVVLDGDHLAWRAPLRAGRAPVAQVRAFRGARCASQWQVIELAGERAVYVEAMRGVGALADALQEARPDLPVLLGSRARRLEGRPKPERPAR